jgi:2-polyprenyl-3-methyl-5-hydroxy-6-metoxy-1,4-benzoquinol methylase
MDARSYRYGEPAADDFRHHNYLIPAVLSILRDAHPERILDLGCGNGLATHVLATRGYRIIGIDPSEEGINWARAHFRTSKCTRVQRMMIYAPVSGHSLW